MSSGELMLGDVVLPGSSVLGHGAVVDVDQMAFEDASGSTGSLGRLVAGQECSCARVESLLDDGRCVEHAVEPPVAASVQPVAFLVGGIDRDRRGPGVAGELRRAGETGDVTDFGKEDRRRDVADPCDLQERGCQRGDQFPDRGFESANTFVSPSISVIISISTRRA
jgi:hypothetical protein